MMKLILVNGLMRREARPCLSTIIPKLQIRCCVTMVKNKHRYRNNPNWAFGVILFDIYFCIFENFGIIYSFLNMLRPLFQLTNEDAAVGARPQSFWLVRHSQNIVRIFHYNHQNRSY